MNYIEERKFQTNPIKLITDEKNEEQMNNLHKWINGYDTYQAIRKEQQEIRRQIVLDEDPRDRERLRDLIEQTYYNNPELLLAANGMFLEYAGPSIRNNFFLVKIAVASNGDAIMFASEEILKNPELAAELILTASVGHPCESYVKAIKDESIIFEVLKKIGEFESYELSWACTHMNRKQYYEKLSKLNKSDELNNMLDEKRENTEETKPFMF